MPHAKSKLYEIAAQAKKQHVPFIKATFPHIKAGSVFYPDNANLQGASKLSPGNRLRVAVTEGDPVDVALDWHASNFKDDVKRASACCSIAVVNMANESRAGGDWESSIVAPEEGLSRRSNLVQSLVTPWNPSSSTSHYPIPTQGGLYSPNVSMCFIPDSPRGDMTEQMNNSGLSFWSRCVRALVT